MGKTDDLLRRSGVRDNAGISEHINIRIEGHHSRHRPSRRAFLTVRLVDLS